MPCSWSLIGSVTLQVDDAAPQVITGRQADLLAVLLLADGRTVSVEAITDALWPESPPSTARNTIQRFVSDLRRNLGAERKRLATADGGYRLDVVRGEFDLAGLLDEARRADVDTADSLGDFATISTALDRLDVDIAPGHDHIEAVRSAELRVEAIRQSLITRASRLVIDERVDATSELRTWSQRHPLDEQVAAALMVSLARSGQQADALAVFNDIAERLLDQLGLDPSPMLRDVELEILQQGEGIRPAARGPLSGDQPTTAPAPAPVEEHRSPRPVPTAQVLYGRAELLATINQVLTEDRLVTLIGPGGTGKTSLALECAGNEGPDAAVALLSDVRSTSMLAETIAAALGVVLDTEDPGEVAAVICDFFARSGTLLVVDNAEHMIDGVAELVEQLVAAAEQRGSASRVLVTSRELLSVPGERVVDVPPLALPGPGADASSSPAVQLFAARAAAVCGRPESEIAADPSTVEICRLADGLPLCLELAAARTYVVSLAKLAQRMAQPMKALGTQRRSTRQSSLEALLDWSWQLLSEDERSLLQALAVFRSWPVEAVEYLDDEDGFELLASLVSKSLVSFDGGDDGGRYFLLETIKDFIRSKMSADDVHAARRRHAEWVVSITTRPQAESLAVSRAHRELGVETANVLSALDWLDDNGCRRVFVDLAARAAASFAHLGPIVEGAARARRALIALDEVCPEHDVVHGDQIDADLRGFLTASSASAALAAGDANASWEARIAASELFDGRPVDWAVESMGLLSLGFATIKPNGRGMEFLERVAAVAADTPSPEINLAQVGANRGQLLLAHRRYADAVDEFERVLSMTPEPGRALLFAETGILGALHMLGRHDEAAERAGSVRSDPHTDTWHYAIDVARAVAVGAGDPEAGLAILDDVLNGDEFQQLPGRSNDVSIAAGVIAWGRGDVDKAIELLSGSMGRLPVFMMLQFEFAEGSPRSPMEPREWARHWNRLIVERITASLVDEGGWVAGTTTELDLRAIIEQLRVSAAG